MIVWWTSHMLSPKWKSKNLDFYMYMEKLANLHNGHVERMPAVLG